MEIPNWTQLSPRETGQKQAWEKREYLGLVLEIKEKKIGEKERKKKEEGENGRTERDEKLQKETLDKKMLACFPNQNQFYL